MRGVITGLIAVVVALTLVSAVLAAGGQKAQGYQGPGESIQGEVQKGESVAGASIAGGALPFSGQDLTLLAVGGVALILVGTGFYRLSRRRL